jgi:hypothetical protein
VTTVADWGTYPLAVVAEKVRGEAVSAWGRTSWNVDNDGILHVDHRDTDGDDTSLSFRLVQVEKVWREVDGD